MQILSLDGFTVEFEDGRIGVYSENTKEQLFIAPDHKTAAKEATARGILLHYHLTANEAR